MTAQFFYPFRGFAYPTSLTPPEKVAQSLLLKTLGL
jgi:hypothetical protein